MSTCNEHIIRLGLIDYTPSPKPDESYEDFLHRWNMTGRGFNYGEIVKPRRKDWRGRFRQPPRDMWSRMLPTMSMANELRSWMVDGYPDKGAARGLRVAAAYRPTGGARRSQHKSNAALDLDLLPSDYDLTHIYYRTAVRLWCEYGRELKIGLGLYCSARRDDGIRVHFDTGYRCRTWQISGGRSIRPYTRNGRSVPLAYNLCERMGLIPPTEEA